MALIMRMTVAPSEGGKNKCPASKASSSKEADNGKGGSRKDSEDGNNG